MDELYEALPFLAAIVLLIIGVVKLRKLSLIASFLVLVIACVFAFINDGTSAACSFVGCFLCLFGFISYVVSQYLKPNNFVSKNDLKIVALLLIVFGVAGMLII